MTKKVFTIATLALVLCWGGIVRSQEAPITYQDNVGAGYPCGLGLQPTCLHIPVIGPTGETGYISMQPYIPALNYYTVNPTFAVTGGTITLHLPNEPTTSLPITGGTYSLTGNPSNHSLPLSGVLSVTFTDDDGKPDTMVQNLRFYNVHSGRGSGSMWGFAIAGGSLTEN
jgi:hypothetical protein